ncbi:MAG: 3,4-dihydroxyphenylacetate 2,3-dioxygenase [Hyphomicrobiales bacterium]
MGRIVLTAKVSHVPSMLLSERDGPLKGSRDEAIASVRELGRRALVRGADTFLVFDTHWIANIGFHLNGNARHRGVYTSPEAPHMIQDLAYDYRGNPELADLVADEAGSNRVKALAHKVPSLGLEYGTIVPMRYMNPDGVARVVPVASPIFASVEENRRFGESVRRAIERSDANVAVIASGSLSHKLWDNADLGPKAWFEISSEFNRQMDLRVLELWREGRFREFVDLLPEYIHKCDGEAKMADTAMLFGLLGWDGYDGEAEQLCSYFPSSGSGQVNVEFWPGKSLSGRPAPTRGRHA